MASSVENSWLDPAGGAHAADHTEAPDDLQRRLIEETAEARRPIPDAGRPEQGAFLACSRSSSARAEAVEVGTFTGYSSLCIARGLPDDGRLLCCDVSDGVDGDRAALLGEAPASPTKIELRIAPAAETLRALPRDAAFRPRLHRRRQAGYLVYYEEILKRLRDRAA